MPDIIGTALHVAYRNREVTEHERNAVLEAMAQHFSGPEGETASRLLHHRIEAAALQLTLDGIVGGDERRAES